ncbi:MAG TPA: DUF4157 domain-containing protein, partial [Nitrospirae bacterium]|nr:DUF4157 domain-containing protein [Nitrospirota bacterium]
MVHRQVEEEEEEDTLQTKLSSTAEPLIQRQTEDEEEETLQAKGQGTTETIATDTIQRTLHSLKGSGQRLPTSVRSFFEPRFGVDFSHVRVHTDSTAARLSRQLNAEAFTYGRDIYFGEGRYNPSTASGKRLLAHELTHVVQQNHNMLRLAYKSRIPVPSTLQVLGCRIQRSLKCSLDHIDKECNNADAVCKSVNTYCNTTYPTPEKINSLYTAAKLGAISKKKSLPNAADNLLHFLDASGSEKVMPFEIFKEHRATKNQLYVHRRKFIEGALKRLKNRSLKVGGSVDMVWTDTANAFNFTEDDLGLAVGGYTLCSKVNVSAKSISSKDVELTFNKWVVQAFDCYNW